MAKLLTLYRERVPVFNFSNTLAAFDTLNDNKVQLLLPALPTYRTFSTLIKLTGFINFKSTKGILYTLKLEVVHRHPLPLPDIQLLLL